jgi:uncharacterized membrane protein
MQAGVRAWTKNHPDGTTQRTAHTPDGQQVSARRLLVIAFEDTEHAQGALATLSDLADDNVLTLTDAAVVVRRRADDGGPGAIEVHQTRELAPGEGAVGGGALGLLLGLAIGLPVAAAVAGMAGGAGFAAARDTGIPNEELRHIGESLGPDGAALAALVESDDWDRVDAALGQRP